MHNLWSAPLRILLGTILLYDGLGVSALVGVGVLGILTPLQIRVMHRQAKLMKTNFLVADRRIKLMNEILPGEWRVWEWQDPLCTESVIITM